ncbi:translation initiation factor IF-2 [Limosilactobacillus fermentum]|nr:translation initiation factor IF-2 [Limosilactobacillus fermentum]KLD54915.1 translation initiation factor IF-2 [Limosilactobacillus fermentum]MCH5396534.1 translation initiation factor IF-2 [Limosilactobacillus fermentum]MDA3723951.1 translation initiation factor IF-2 [Limosilactobacillus fermentum]MDA3761491.1 translation initiation factor IF-2 [Limosilactobacillus fermentum]NHD44400.1 translation initiation factor IF-2 [Limosilactobacillus fermentum]
MAKERIYELAKELKMPSKDLVNLAKKEGMDVKTHMSSVTSDEANKLRSMAKGAGKPAAVKPAPKVQEHQSAPAKKEASRPDNQGSQNNQNRNNRGNRNNNGNNNRHNSNNGSANANGNGGNQKRNQKRNQNNNNNQGGQAANRNNNNGQGQGAHWFKKGKKNNKKKNRNKGNQRLRDTAPKAPTQRKDRPLPDVLEYTNGMNAQDLGKILHRSPAEIIKKLFMLGVMVNQNQSLDADTIEILAADYGIGAKEKVQVDVADLDHFFDERINNDANLADRPPVVTVMGHVDHGKTTLLDKIRHSHVTEGEAGGITQAIGAYQVKYNDKLITFLDTPGHAAFTEMRARGANITDITVLVVAADDGVMPQTIEAINHAKAAGTPIIVVVNKIDKPGANPDHVTEQLTEYGLIPEDWGGDTIYVKVSAKFGKNIDELLDMILLQAEVMELKANPDQNAAGAVVEARLDQGKGSVATLLVQQGTLHVGDPIVVGDTFGRVRTMTNENGRRIKDATPSTPVEITGLNGVPEAGDHFVVFDDEKTARAAGEERAKRAEDEKRRRTSHVTLDNLFDTMKKGEMKSLPIIIKADVQGSVEALAQSLQKIQVDGVRVDIIHKAVGAISESDVTLAEASNAIIIGFNVRPTPLAKSEAETNNIDIRLHRVIYNAIEEVEDAMKGMLEPVYEEEVLGQVEVRQLYKASKIGTIAGGMVVSGKITRDAKVRLIRDGVVIYEGELGSLKRFKDDAKEVKMGFECGLTIKNFNDVKENDVIEAYHMKEVPVK